MANRIDTPVDRVETPSLQPAVDRARCQPELLELSPPDDSVLLLRQPSGEPINGLIEKIRLIALAWATIRPPLTTSEVEKGGRIGHAADTGGTRRTRGARNGAKGARKGGSSPPVPPLALIP